MPTDSPTIHEATLASGPSGAVEWGSNLTQEEAVARRQQELDIIVRGDDETANRQLAKTVEEQPAGPSRRIQPRPDPTRCPIFIKNHVRPPATLCTKPRNAKPRKESHEVLYPRIGIQVWF